MYDKFENLTKIVIEVTQFVYLFDEDNTTNWLTSRAEELESS